MGGYAAANINDLGDGPGFRKVRRALDVTAFGVNAIVLPEGYDTGPHFHEEQEELYFVHAGEVEFAFGEDGADTKRVAAGGVVRVDAPTVRSVKNVGNGEAVYLVVGGKDGYVGRDGRTPGDDA